MRQLHCNKHLKSEQVMANGFDTWSLYRDNGRGMDWWYPITRFEFVAELCRNPAEYSWRLHMDQTNCDWKEARS